ncbi:MAG: DUF4097 family beta strand repeat protein [Streptosporangiales bacterium]|nr:DUF4097 family beta strand repeat protein [Streptosporangiales bacterium]
MSSAVPARTRRTGAIVAVVLVVGAAVSIAFALRDSFGGDGVSGTRTLSASAKHLFVDVESGDVTVRKGSTDDVRLTRTVRGRSPRIVEESRNDGVHVSADCPAFTFGRCDVSYEIVVPADMRVEIDASSGAVQVDGVTGGTQVEASSGTITAKDLGGEVELESSSGDVNVTGASGNLDVSASSGEIKADGLTGGRVKAESSSGDVVLGFAAAPDRVELDVSSGDATITLPGGSTTYKVDVETSSGDEQVDVPTDPDAAHEITVEASSGDVTISRR